jgi:glycosyltransferase involved in cell wall biosynthesis
MKKIGLSCNAFRHSGGLERYAMDLASGLAASGARPAVFARRFDKSLPGMKLIEPHRITVNWMPGKLRDYYFSWRLRAARRAADVDVLIGCNRVDCSEIAICGGTHRGYLRASGRQMRSSDKRQIELESRQYERAQYVVAHSRLMRDELVELYGLPASKIELLYPPIDARRFTPVDEVARAALRQSFGFADDEVVMLFPSSSHERKGLPLIEAALRDTTLPVVVAVAGRAPERTSSRLRYIGYAKQIEDCYRAADFTVLASNYEPFGMVGIESVLCGTPVVFSTNIACGEVLSDDVRIDFEPGNVDSLRAAMASAVERVRSRNARIADATRAIGYDPSLQAHVNALLALAERVTPA